MAKAEIQKSQQSAQESQQRALDSQRRARIRELEGEVERYRQASEDALQQLDWCIGYSTALEKGVSTIAFKKPFIHPHTSVEAGRTANAQSRDRRELACITAVGTDER